MNAGNGNGTRNGTEPAEADIGDEERARLRQRGEEFQQRCQARAQEELRAKERNGPGGFQPVLLIPNPWEGRVYYDKNSGSYWIPEDEERNRWTRVNETAVTRELREVGVNPQRARGEGNSEQDRALMTIQKRFNVGYAGKLAGYNAGLVEQNGERILVTASPARIEPEPGEFPIIERFLNGLFKDQRIHFDSWLKLGVESRRKGLNRPGQAIVFAGPKDCGKSVLQNQILTALFGGRMAKPYLYMSGQTPFNGNLFEAEHLMIEDDIASCDIRARRNFGTHIKQFTANEEIQHHAKGKQAMTLKPFWRLSISCNDEPENLMILPPMDPSLSDKMIILKAFREPMPMPTESPEERAAFQAKIREELPHYLDYLLRMEIPVELRASRYGVIAYHNPEVLRDMNESAPEFQLLELIDTDLAGCVKPWKGKASSLESQLLEQHSPVREQAKKLLYHSNTCGTYLSRLADKVPERVTTWMSNGIKKYIISGFPPHDDGTYGPKTLSLMRDSVNG
jgi:hypothetical protein